MVGTEKKGKVEAFYLYQNLKGDRDSFRSPQAGGILSHAYDILSGIFKHVRIFRC